jgi:branched-chain amino acid transport system substrate-binding protein
MVSRLAGKIAALVAVTAVAAVTVTATATAQGGNKPIVIGMINQENSAAGTWIEGRLAAEATAKYINEKRGGIGGRPIQLETCITDGTPEGSASCANEILGKNPVVIAGGANLGAAGSQPILDSAGVPVLGGALLTPFEWNTPVNRSFVSFAASIFPAMTRYAVEKDGAKSIALLIQDGPAGRAVNQLYFQPTLKGLGATAAPVFYPEGVADFTPFVQQANASHPDAILTLVTAANCARTLQAAKSLSVQAKIYLPGSCAEPEQLDAAGDSAEGATMVADFNVLDTKARKSKAGKTFFGVLNKYGHDIPITSFSLAGYNTMLTIKSVLEKTGMESLTSEAILATVEASVDARSPLAHLYTCDGKQIPDATAFCNSYVRIVGVKDGKLVDLVKDWYSGAAALADGKTGA